MLRRLGMLVMMMGLLGWLAGCSPAKAPGSEAADRFADQAAQIAGIESVVMVPDLLDTPIPGRWRADVILTANLLAAQQQQAIAEFNRQAGELVLPNDALLSQAVFTLGDQRTLVAATTAVVGGDLLAYLDQLPAHRAVLTEAGAQIVVAQELASVADLFAATDRLAAIGTPDLAGVITVAQNDDPAKVGTAFSFTWSLPDDPTGLPGQQLRAALSTAPLIERLQVDATVRPLLVAYHTTLAEPVQTPPVDQPPTAAELALFAELAGLAAADAAEITLTASHFPQLRPYQQVTV